MANYEIRVSSHTRRQNVYNNRLKKKLEKEFNEKHEGKFGGKTIYQKALEKFAIEKK